MSTPARYPRDLVGYGRNPPHARWPGNARVAVQFVLNYEEGGENAVLHGDAGSEQFLSEMFNPPPTRPATCRWRASTSTARGCGASCASSSAAACR
jgi:peptidoglycan/xylan/chitin deacetylase (PgdA/CDA1 family)